jgi:hypothetical protein
MARSLNSSGLNEIFLKYAINIYCLTPRISIPFALLYFFFNLNNNVFSSNILYNLLNFYDCYILPVSPQ